MVTHYAHFYAGGSFRPCTGNGKLAVIDPSSGQPIGGGIPCSAADVEMAVACARTGSDAR